MGKKLLLIRRQWLLLLVLMGLCGCNRARALAELESKQGTVERHQSDSAQSWKMAELGADFYLGDAIRTARESAALLLLDGGGKLTVKQNSVVRFANQRPSPKTKAFELEAGQAVLEAGENELLLKTEAGVARLAARGQMLISRTDSEVKFDVTVGRARIETPEGASELDQGQSYTVSVGRAVIEPADRRDAGMRLEDSKQPPASSAVAPIEHEASTSTISGIAVLVSGSGVGKKGPTDTKFERLNPGENQIPYGTTLRIDKSSEVSLKRDGASVVLMGAGDYHLGASDGQLEMHNGRVSVTGALRILLPGGVIETKDRTLAQLESLDKKRTRVRVSRGSATLTNARQSLDVGAGEEGTLTAEGSAQLDGQSLAYSDITIRAGESLTVHDPLPPTAVRFQFETSCPAGGVIRILSNSKRPFAAGVGSTSLALGPGRHEYSLHCLDDNGVSPDVAARGTLSIVRDAGTRPVPETPPSSSVSVDGRNYTILYQNQLPHVSITWPNAPQAPSYKLFVKSRNGVKTYTTESPRYSFRSGALSEGHHTIHFEAAGRSSRHTEVAVAFDNAAPTANLMTPIDPEISPTGEVVLLGVAQPGWRVEIGGAEVAQDGQRRFFQRLAAPTSERAVAVKLVHPTRGTHVYLRRVVKKP